ncbi:MAG: class E sortase [Candidatus Nanopelagicales bacterium]
MRTAWFTLAAFGSAAVVGVAGAGAGASTASVLSGTVGQAAVQRPATKNGSKLRTFARLTVPKAGVRSLRIARYPGRPDDRVGTMINNRGRAAAPHGRWGGVGPGQVGNFLLTGHRTSAGAPLSRVPQLRKGQKIFITKGSTTYVYTVASQMWINFRSAKSRARQTAQVPGHPGRKATRSAIVLSTCATPEDNAAGRRWRDRFHNPTHRIAVVGYLSGARFN